MAILVNVLGKKKKKKNQGAHLKYLGKTQRFTTINYLKNEIKA